MLARMCESGKRFLGTYYNLSDRDLERELQNRADFVLSVGCTIRKIFQIIQPCVGSAMT